MKKPISIFIICILIGWINWKFPVFNQSIFTPTHEDSPTETPKLSTGAPKEHSSEKILHISQATLPAVSQPRLRYAQKSENNAIDFKVVDGFAVAYGDVILGKPEAGYQGDNGSYEAPTPQLWDKIEIPYLINPELPNPKRVEKALDYFTQHTVLKFVPYENQRDAIVFEIGRAHV